MPRARPDSRSGHPAHTPRNRSDSGEAARLSALQALSNSSHRDSTHLAMQNAVSIQQGMQIVTHTSVTSTCALILEQGQN